MCFKSFAMVFSGVPNTIAHWQCDSYNAYNREQEQGSKWSDDDTSIPSVAAKWTPPRSPQYGVPIPTGTNPVCPSPSSSSPSSSPSPSAGYYEVTSDDSCSAAGYSDITSKSDCEAAASDKGHTYKNAAGFTKKNPKATTSYSGSCGINIFCKAWVAAMKLIFGSGGVPKVPSGDIPPYCSTASKTKGGLVFNSQSSSSKTCSSEIICLCKGSRRRNLVVSETEAIRCIRTKTLQVRSVVKIDTNTKKVYFHDTLAELIEAYNFCYVFMARVQSVGQEKI
jgi:hypothetical protein